ncbi:MAG: endonuclease domain-containing protein [Janthinobacterium lividum]
MEEQIKPQNVVVGQQVQEAKVILAQNMRREMTTSEAILWTRLRRNGLGINFRRQQIIDGFIADFYCHSAALVIEVDGPTHDPEYDAERDRIFGIRGITVLRFTNNDVSTRISYVLSRLRQHLANKTPDPPQT